MRARVRSALKELGWRTRDASVSTKASSWRESCGAHVAVGDEREKDGVVTYFDEGRGAVRQ